MKKFIVILAAILMIVSIAGIAQADYIQSLDIYEYSVGGTIEWNHTYDFSETPPVTASLSIVADDVDGPGNGTDGEQDAVYLNGILLGYLVDMGYYTNWNYEPGPGNSQQPVTTTTFSLDTSLLDWTMPITVSIESLWGAEIETSTLTVASVPDASIILLLGSSLMGLAVFSRKSKRTV